MTEEKTIRVHADGTHYADDFSMHPPSIAEIRSDRTGHAKDWTPRDTLVSTLRALDAGEINPDALVVIYRKRDPDGATYTHFRLSSPDQHVTLGLLRAVEWEMMWPNYSGRR